MSAEQTGAISRLFSFVAAELRIWREPELWQARWYVQGGANGMFVVIADGLTALGRAPESNSRRSRGSTVFIGRLRGGLGTLSLLRRRRLALHLFLGILRRRCCVSSCTIHRAGGRMLINFSAGSHRLSGITRSGSGTCILCARGLANGVARASLRGGSTQNQDSAATRRNRFVFICSSLVAVAGIRLLHRQIHIRQNTTAWDARSELE